MLQAADILIYHSNLVPVGQDQKQHIEMTRDIATKFNNIFGEVLVLPGAVHPRVDRRGARHRRAEDVQELRQQHRHLRGGQASQAEGHVHRDRLHAGRGAQGPRRPPPPSCCSGSWPRPQETAEWAARYRAGGMGYGEVKKRVLELLDETFAPFRERRKELEADPAYVEDVLADGGRRPAPRPR